MATSSQRNQELFKAIWTITEDLRNSVDGRDFKRIVEHENKPGNEIDSIFRELMSNQSDLSDLSDLSELSEKGGSI